ncbi:uncharacterized protein [Choristoneura fumiferana]|uniref:uncharacterized protein n=1 Tax=Choristoneura fumiferana TaxID=7141 RepID=UPI003D15B6E1
MPTLIPGTDIPVLCDMTTGKPRPSLPPQHRRPAFERLHGLSHPGARATARLVADRYVWPGVNKVYRTRARECLPYQRSKRTCRRTRPTSAATTASISLSTASTDVSSLSTPASAPRS